MLEETLKELRFSEFVYVCVSSIQFIAECRKNDTGHWGLPNVNRAWLGES